MNRTDRRRNRRSRPDSEAGPQYRPFRQLRNPLPPVELLSPEQLAQVHESSMRILEEIGIEFLSDEALAIWKAAGARVNKTERRVWPDRGLVMEAVAKAPAEFKMVARNPEHTLRMGGSAINFATVGAAPYYSDLKQGRRPGRLADFRQMVKLAQYCNPIHIVEGLLVEPQDIEVAARNLEKGLALFTLSDKVITTAAHGKSVAEDYVNLAAIAFGGMEVIQEAPVFASNVNANSPLRYDTQMLEALIVYARSRQALVITPFILAGAMSPITMAGAIAQQNAEALAGIALTQLINPSTPVIYGGFTTNLDMQSGSPAFGTPEGAKALICGAQLARHYGLPYRGSGGLNNSKVPDAQAGYETQMTLWPAVMAHANLILHSAGWLEAGLVCSLEKFIIDVEGLAMMHNFLDGIVIDDATLALGSIAEVGPGGHHLGTAHTMARYRSEFFIPEISDRNNYEAWLEGGALDAAQRAHVAAHKMLARYERPPMEASVGEALTDYVERRKREMGASDKG